MQGCKAEPPGKAEVAIVTKAKHSIFVGNRNTRNPLESSAQNIADGNEAFTHYCVVCHGMDGQNTGVPFAEQMSPPVPSLASPVGSVLHGRAVEMGDSERHCPIGHAGSQGNPER